MTAQAGPCARRGIPFLVWGWAMLLVVALSAAPTGGEVRTRVIGSAFDPATVSVALSPKQAKSKARTVAKVARGSAQVERTTVSPPAVHGEVAVAPSPAAWLGPAPGAVPAQVSVPIAGPWPKALGARAPPSA